VLPGFEVRVALFEVHEIHFTRVQPWYKSLKTVVLRRGQRVNVCLLIDTGQVSWLVAIAAGRLASVSRGPFVAFVGFCAAVFRVGLAALRQP